MSKFIGAKITVLPGDSSSSIVQFKWTVLPTAKVIVARPDLWAAVPVDAGKKIPVKRTNNQALARPKK